MRMLIRIVAIVALMSGAAVGQPVASNPNYPGPGHAFQFDFGLVSFKNEFTADGKQMTFTRLSDGRTGTVNFTAIEVRPNVFWNYWVETDGTSVARVEDHESRTAHAMVHFPDGKIVNLSGTFRRLD
jgi:hypothetical protein